MNNNTQEGYCSEKVIQLLKEKGCKITQRIITTFPHPTDKNNTLQSDEHTISHSLAIKWLRENFGWNIEINYQPENDDYLMVIVKLGHIDSQEKRTQISNIRGFNSSEEATEVALLYTLQNLI